MALSLLVASEKLVKSALLLFAPFPAAAGQVEFNPTTPKCAAQMRPFQAAITAFLCNNNQTTTCPEIATITT